MVMYAKKVKHLNKDPLYQDAGVIARDIRYEVVLSAHDDTMYIFTNRIEDTVGDAPRVAFTC